MKVKIIANSLPIIFVLNKSVALADQCFHQPARFRHRNMYLIRFDHLPLGKFVISNCTGDPTEHDICGVFTHCTFYSFSSMENVVGQGQSPGF